MRILSGVQPTGKLHIGNYFGAIRQFVALQREPANECFYFVADLHAITTIKDGRELRGNSFMVAADFIALGLDPNRSVLYRQSDVPEVAELAWMLSTVTPMGLLQRGHSYKDKVAKGIAPNHGLFAYPVLMAADILIVRADRVPVGRDQKQHLEMTRDIAGAFNQTYAGELLRVPEELILSEVAVVPGIDGQKMSKSYGNAVLLSDSKEDAAAKVKTMFTDPAKIRKDDKGHPEGCVVYAMHSLYTAEAKDIEGRCKAGTIGCVACKGRLGETLSAALDPIRSERARWSSKIGDVKAIVIEGSKKADAVAEATMVQVRRAVKLADEILKLPLQDRLAWSKQEFAKRGIGNVHDDQ